MGNRYSIFPMRDKFFNTIKEKIQEREPELSTTIENELTYWRKFYAEIDGVTIALEKNGWDGGLVLGVLTSKNPFNLEKIQEKFPHSSSWLAFKLYDENNNLFEDKYINGSIQEKETFLNQVATDFIELYRDIKKQLQQKPQS